MSVNQPNPKFNSGQHFKNLISNILLVGINLLISFWYTPYLIQNLGSELFGFIPLADSVTYFLGIFTLSINVSISRYLTIELEKGDLKHANVIFNTTLVTTLIIITLVAPIGIALVLLAPHIFNIPSNQEHAIQWLFAGTITAFLLTTVQANFSIATFANNRFDLRNIVSLAARVGQVLVILFYFTTDSPNLIWVGAGALAAAMLSILGDFFLWKRLLPNLRLSLSSFDRKFLPTLFGTGFWALVYQLGFIIFLNVDILVANKTLPLSQAGMYGALLVIPKNLRILATAVGSIWGPSILSHYSKGDYRGVDAAVKLSVKISGLVTALPVGLLVGLSQSFLVLWLGPDFKIMSWVLIIMIIHLSATLINSPFYNVQLSFNKIKLPALISVFIGLINFLLAYLLSPRFGALGITIAGAICLIANNLLFSPIYTARIMRLGGLHYLKRLLVVSAATILVAAISYLVNFIIPARSLMDLLWIGLFISGAYAVLAYYIVLSNDERQLISSVMQRSLGIIRREK